MRRDNEQGVPALLDNDAQIAVAVWFGNEAEDAVTIGVGVIFQNHFWRCDHPAQLLLKGNDFRVPPADVLPTVVVKDNTPPQRVFDCEDLRHILYHTLSIIIASLSGLLL